MMEQVVDRKFRRRLTTPGLHSPEVECFVCHEKIRGNICMRKHLNKHLKAGKITDQQRTDFLQDKCVAPKLF